ncbi:Cullin family protein [Phytophthora cinnamomi]|uniref:Cullin family protein n=1 Tax=Phytophthora cinnamomi TaxID=4785 RepID=UPI00355994C2|nr:Cullin family protein [Phytophthora cinnamomi]
MAESELAGLRSVAVQSTHIHRVQLLSLPAPASAAAKPRAAAQPSLRARLQRQWRANAWLLLTLGFLCCLGRLRADAAGATAAKSKADSDLYVVLVSIPVLDKMLPLKHLAETLLSRGARVGFALPENCRQWVSDLDGLEFISLGSIVGKGRATALDPTQLQTLGVYESYASTLRYYASFQRPMFAPLLEDLEDDRPDLVVVDRYTFAGFDACHRLQLPYVVNDPHLLFDVDSPPAYIPAPFSNFTMHTTSVLERCLNSYYRLRFRLGLVHVYKEINAVREEHGLEPIDSKHQMHGHSLVLVNSVFGLDEARPMTPQFKMVGLLQSRKLQLERAAYEASPVVHTSLPEALTTWLEAAAFRDDKPLVFISFQTDVPLTPEFITTIMNALETVDARLLWKITLQEQAAFDLRSRPRDSVLFLGDGVDDAAVLALAPEIELLITAGEFQTMQEALVVGVPILGLPHSAEQIEGMNAVVRAGAGLRLDGKSFSEGNLRLAVDRMLIDERERFKAKAEHLGELVKTGGGVERAADELLAVAEFGARHLLPMRNLQPLYKTYLVDVYLIYGAILCGAAIILRTFVSVVLSVFQPLTPLEVLEAEELAANGLMSRADEVGRKAVQ